MTSAKPPFRPSKSEIQVPLSIPASARRTIPATPRARHDEARHDETRHDETRPSGSYALKDAEVEVLPEVKRRRRA